MRNFYLLLAALLLATAYAHAQQPWQPFRPGLSYQYTETVGAADTTHVLRLGTGTPAAGSATDSVFRFTGRMGFLGEARGNANCWGLGRLRPDNLFGATLRSQPRAVFVLAAANGRSLTLRPRAPLGQSWATGLPGLTATVSSRALEPVLGAAPDSVATILLSDGRALRLSKTYGLLAGPSLDSYLNGRYARRLLTLTALPERQLGTALTTPRAIFGYQPGDVFQRFTENRLNGIAGGVICRQTWQQDSVLTSTSSRTGDTLTYTVRTWQVQRGYGATGAPINFCSAPSGLTYSAGVTTWQVTGLLASPHLSSAFEPLANTPAGQRTTAVVASSSNWGGRAGYSATWLRTCPNAPADSVSLMYIIDNELTISYAVGLGQTYRHETNLNEDNTSTLTAFRKGTQTWGAFLKPATLLAARDVQPASTTAAFPTPFAESLTVSFALAGPQSVEVLLYDALGRPVRRLPAQALAAGPRQLMLPTAELPAGLYTLHLRFGADGHREVLKVVK